MRGFSLVALATLLLVAAPPARAAKHKLDDAQLAKITAGGVSVQNNNGVIDFQFEGAAGSTHSVSGSGTVAPLGPGAAASDLSQLILNDNAQQNLQSFININAVNSQVQLLINLTVNVNSTVGTLLQNNGSSGQ